VCILSFVGDLIQIFFFLLVVDHILDYAQDHYYIDKQAPLVNTINDKMVFHTRDMKGGLRGGIGSNPYVDDD
jgi:hypothetical protein